MDVSELFKNKTVFSIEIFPPKTALGREKLMTSLLEIRDIQPDFISITQSAAACFNEQRTLAIAQAIQQKLGIATIAHVPCLYRTKEEVKDYLTDLEAAGVQNILALRGDAGNQQICPRDFTYASDLINFINRNGHFDISAAAYPQKHPESSDVVSDTLHLKEKVQAGAKHLITQMVFDNQDYWEFKERLALADIHVPVEVGILPCTNSRQIKRITKMSGIKLPKKIPGHHRALRRRSRRHA
ncbi:methylenetetrahydrofolate reductase [Fructobacillus fructosus]|uniref:methylenetetrahydrofolate reductase n=1 Tax=Fructobacillus fructosus TaxID=1631 RepID=UPI00030A984A|nr:methylenetetrahydrofolate reductase [Fructobacillus fructosus]